MSWRWRSRCVGAVSSVALHGGRARGHDDVRVRMALGHIGVDAVLVEGAVRRDGGDRLRDLVEQGADLGGVVLCAGHVQQPGGESPIGVKIALDPARVGTILGRCKTQHLSRRINLKSCCGDFPPLSILTACRPFDPGERSMRATVMYRAGDVRIENLPDATIVHPTDAVIRITRACICGSDLWPYNLMEPAETGRRMGHEGIGVVEAVGAGVRTVK